MSVCLPACLSVHAHNSKTVRPNFTSFLCMLSMSVAWSSSDGIVIRYVLPVLRMTSSFHTMGPIGGWMGTIATGRALAARSRHWTIHPICQAAFAASDFRIKHARHAIQSYEKSIDVTSSLRQDRSTYTDWMC